MGLRAGSSARSGELKRQLISLKRKNHVLAVSRQQGSSKKSLECQRASMVLLLWATKPGTFQDNCLVMKNAFTSLRPGGG